MTAYAFLKKYFAPIAGNFSVTPVIRDSDGLCPLCAIAKRYKRKHLSNANFDKAGTLFGLSQDAYSSIAMGADSTRYSTSAVACRSTMLRMIEAAKPKEKK